MEITNHAHSYLEGKMQGMQDSSEYGYHIETQDQSGLLAGANLFGGEIQIAGADDAMFNTEYETQLMKIQLERNKKY